MGRRNATAGLAITLSLAALWSWWAWKAGAYFGVVFYPGAIAVLLLLALLLLRGPLEARLAGIPDVAFGSLLLIGALSMFSVLWTPAREAALEDAQHAVHYAAVFLLGFWGCHLLGRKMLLSLLPLALASAVAGLVVLANIWWSDDVVRLLEGDGTLRYPIGYRNANAAFFLIGFWPTITLASRPGRSPVFRGAMLGGAVLALEIAILSQSRASVLAATIALVVYLIWVPGRARALAYLLLAALPAAAALPWLVEVFQAGGGEPSLDALRPAARAVALTAGGAAAIGALAAALEARLELEGPDEETGRPVMVGAGILLAAAALALAVSSTDPVDWVGDRVQEVRHGGTPDLAAEEARFSTNVSSDRYDLWRVAWNDAEQSPLGGEGAGGFQYSYLRARDTDQTPNDPHSVELLMLSELGVPGLLLFLAFLAAAAIGVLRSRALGPSAAALSAAAIATGVYWLVHASVEWFWSYPALTAPTIALLGAACAPARLDPGSGPARPTRIGLAAVAIVVAVAAIPAFLSDRYLDRAFRDQGSLDAAYADLDRAADLNPLSDKPELAEGVLASRAGDRTRAIAALRRAEERKPEEWATHYLLGRILAERDPAAARRELERALELNPRDPRIRAALERLP